MTTKINLFLVGIGTGNPDHVTRQAEQMLRAADIIIVPYKGTSKSDLADLRYQICDQLLGTDSPPIFSFELPVRDSKKSYLAAVDDWHDAIALVWADTIQNASAKLDQPLQNVALLIWGDPSLYDSSMRIAARLDPEPAITVAPGITSVQARQRHITFLSTRSARRFLLPRGAGLLMRAFRAIRIQPSSC